MTHMKNDNGTDDYFLTEAEIADAQSKSLEQVIDEGICDVIDIGLYEGLTDETIDEILQDLLTRRSRSRFKIL